jgi:hypothetical protein
MKETKARSDRMRKFATLGAVVALGISGAAMAAESPSHSFVEAGYGYSEVGGGAALDGDGFNVGASFELPANFIVAASYRDYDYGAGNVSELSGGLGYKWALSDSFDFVTAASYEQVDVDGSGEFTGFGVSVGVRGLLTDTVEMTANLKYNDLEAPLPTYFSASLGMRKYFNPSFAAGVEVRKGELLIAGETSLVATLRYDFGSMF